MQHPEHGQCEADQTQVVKMAATGWNVLDETELTAETVNELSAAGIEQTEESTASNPEPTATATPGALTEAEQRAADAEARAAEAESRAAAAEAEARAAKAEAEAAMEAATTPGAENTEASLPVGTTEADVASGSRE